MIVKNQFTYRVLILHNHIIYLRKLLVAHSFYLTQIASQSYIIFGIKNQSGGNHRLIQLFVIRFIPSE